MEDIAL